MEDFKLSTLAGGALDEQFGNSVRKVLNNMRDVNTPYKKTREINIKLKFTQNEQRDDIQIDALVSEKLAPVNPIQTQMYVDQDIRTGEIFTHEYGHEVMRGQMHLNDYATEQEDDPDEEADSTQQNKTVVDFREAMNS